MPNKDIHHHHYQQQQHLHYHYDLGTISRRGARIRIRICIMNELQSTIMKVSFITRAHKRAYII